MDEGFNITGMGVGDDPDDPGVTGGAGKGASGYAAFARAVQRVNKAVDTLSTTLDKFERGPLGRIHQGIQRAREEAEALADSVERVEGGAGRSGMPSVGGGARISTPRAKAPKAVGGNFSGVTGVGESSPVVNGGGPAFGGPPTPAVAAAAGGGVLGGGGAGGVLAAGALGAGMAGGGNGGGITFGGVLKAGGAALATGALLANRTMAVHEDPARERDRIATMFARSGGSLPDIRHGMTRGPSVLGATSMEDRNAAMGLLRAGTGAAAYNSPNVQTGMTSMSQIAQALPGMGQEFGAQAHRGMMNPSGMWGLRQLGVQVRPGGQERDFASIMQDYTQAAFGGTPTRQQAQSVGVQGSMANAMLASAFPDEASRKAAQEYLLGSAQIGRPISSSRDIQSAFGSTEGSVTEQTMRSTMAEIRKEGTQQEGILQALVKQEGRSETFQNWMADKLENVPGLNALLGEISVILSKIYTPVVGIATAVGASKVLGIGLGGGAARAAGGVGAATVGGKIAATAAGLGFGPAALIGAGAAAGALGGEVGYRMASDEDAGFLKRAAGIGVTGLSGPAGMAWHSFRNTRDDLRAARERRDQAFDRGESMGFWESLGRGDPDDGTDHHYDHNEHSPSFHGLDPRARRGLKEMMEDNPNIQINSGKRSSAEQQALYEAGGSPVPPGGSRHERGTAVDLGPSSEYGWLRANASRYGFESVVDSEPWHFEVAGTRDPHSKHFAREKEKGGYAVGTGAPLPDSLRGQTTIPAMEAYGKLFPGARMTSAYRKGSTTYHGRGQATDWGGPSPSTAGYRDPGLRGVFNHWARLEGKLRELFLTGAPHWISGGRRVPAKSTGRIAETHKDHVHVATTSSDLGAGIAATSTPWDGGVGESTDTGSSVATLIGGGAQHGHREEIDALKGIWEGGPGSGLNEGSSGSGERVDIGTGDSYPDGISVSGAGIDTAVRAGASAGMRGQHLVKMTAIAGAESNFNPHAVGDVGLQNATWGPSIGLWQIRSLNAERGKGSARDADRLKDPNFNARSAQQIWSGRPNYRDWSVTHGSNPAYRKYMGAAREAVEKLGVGDPDDIRSYPVPGGGHGPSGADFASFTYTGGNGAPQVASSRPTGRRGGGSGGGITIAGDIHMEVRLANGSRAEVERLFDNLQEVAEERAAGKVLANS